MFWRWSKPWRWVVVLEAYASFRRLVFSPFCHARPELARTNRCIATVSRVDLVLTLRWFALLGSKDWGCFGKSRKKNISVLLPLCNKKCTLLIFLKSVCYVRRPGAKQQHFARVFKNSRFLHKILRLWVSRRHILKLLDRTLHCEFLMPDDYSIMKQAQFWKNVFDIRGYIVRSNYCRKHGLLFRDRPRRTGSKLFSVLAFLLFAGFNSSLISMLTLLCCSAWTAR